MKFKRHLDSGYPHVWDTWESHGATWVIQDLPPEDDEKALLYLVTYFIPDEVSCGVSKLQEDPVSVKSIIDYWTGLMSQRMSLACYHIKDGERSLAALNICEVLYQGEQIEHEPEGDAWKNVFYMMAYLDTQFDTFKYLEVDRLLYGSGLLVKREFRGEYLGARLLAARKPLCLSQGVKATATVFTGPASQKVAAACGFTTVLSKSMRSLREAGLDYPDDDQGFMKVMVKKFA